MRLRGKARLGLTITGWLLLGWACSQSSPTQPGATPAALNGGERPAPEGTPTPGSSPSPKPSPSSSPAPAPSSAPSCPYGKGTLDSTCTRHLPVFLAQVNAAIEQAVAQHPELFNLADQVEAGAYKVLNPDLYYAAVVSNLQSMGFCANYDLSHLQLKNSNDFSEDYDILLATNHVRRGIGSYRSTCAPASFPVDAADFIAYIRVGFYKIDCPDGRTPPHNNEAKIPVGCTGFVTATPKTRNDQPVDPRVHGPDILWIHREGHEYVQVSDFPDQPFNHIVDAILPGKWELCAQVKGVEGCMNGEVIP